MPSFHIALHARPAGDWEEHRISVEGFELVRLKLPPESLVAPLPISFESAVSRLAVLRRMFVEPDGSLVWVSDSLAEASWQIDGELFDRGGQLQYVELRGSCTADAFEQLTSVFRTSDSAFVIQLLRHAVFISETEFRRFAFGRDTY